KVHNTAHTDITNNFSLPLGTVVHDTATTGGQVDGIPVTGAITFTFYTASTACSGATGSIGSGSEATFAAATAASSPLKTGSYSFIATIASDANYNSATASCEPFAVGKATPTLSTKVHNTAHTDITGSTTVPNGSIVHDTA